MAGIYLDCAATTPVDPRVAERMATCLTADGDFGNPASPHAWGRSAALRVDRAREAISTLIGASTEEIVFTAGATEANNLALKGAAAFRRERGRHIVTSATEHKAVIDVCRELSFSGFEVSHVPVTRDGRVEPEAVRDALREDTILVSIMHANNETGVINDIGAIGSVVHERGAWMHVDAAQTAGKLPIDVATEPIDLLSLSAHKNHGPKGIGALWIRRRPRVRLLPLLHGGGHERGLRAGTLATHQVVGMGEAFAIALEEGAADAAHSEALAGRLLDGLGTMEAWAENGAGAPRLSNIRNLRFDGVEGESLASLLADEVAISTGSACTTGSIEPSHVLRAMGQDAATAAGAVRLSWGRSTREADIDLAVAAIRDAVNRLRGNAVHALGGGA